MLTCIDDKVKIEITLQKMSLLKMNFTNKKIIELKVLKWLTIIGKEKAFLHAL